MVLYTILGAVTGGIVSFVGGSLFGVERGRGGRMFAFSSQDVLTFGGIVLGGAIGFGYGSAMLFSGHYLPWN